MLILFSDLRLVIREALGAAAPVIDIKPYDQLTDDETDQLKALSRGTKDGGGSMYPSLSFGKRPGTGTKYVAVMAKVDGEVLAWWSVYRSGSNKPGTGPAFVDSFTSKKHRGNGLGKMVGQAAIRFIVSNWRPSEIVCIPMDAAGEGFYASFSFKPSSKGETWTLAC